MIIVYREAALLAIVRFFCQKGIGDLGKGRWAGGRE